MPLIPDSIRAALLANGVRSSRGETIDPRPLIKLFTPDANATWLLTELDPEDPRRAFGLCDLGLGSPELGYISLAELEALRGPMGLPVEQDLHFQARMPLSGYAIAARRSGSVST